VLFLSPTTEYTVLQVQNLRDSDVRHDAGTAVLPEVMVKGAVRAIYDVSELIWQISRDDSAGVKETCSRPPVDLGGALADTIWSILWSYDSLARGDP